MYHNHHLHETKHLKEANLLQEEKYLVGVFGAEYEEYRKQVFRYFGRKGSC